MASNPEQQAFLLQHQFRFAWNQEEGATVDSTEWLEIGEGINNIEPAGNEVLVQDQYYSGGGFATTDVIGKQTVWTIGGHRDYNDPFQNVVFNELVHELGAARRGTFRITYPDGTIFLTNSTIANIKEPGGDAVAKGGISLEVHNNEKPRKVSV
ncbi:phage tail tube protein [Atopococcus tabaci]|uniref:phage tail tube protein n=1 Tax=Atopococcus tabaci TaxID=269774 RepID=UPI002408FA96|nr:hypothetical protein [Atopococcus tabaci]